MGNIVKRNQMGTWILAIILCIGTILLPGCGSDNYAPGTYEGTSSGDEDGDYTTVSLTIGEDGTITEAELHTYEKDGTEKTTADYGKQEGEVANADFYEKAQVAVKANETYAKELVEKQQAMDVDSISGATITYNQMQEAVRDALSKAAE